jgi:hypothetical protein
MYLYIYLVTINLLFKFLGPILSLLCVRNFYKIEESMCTSLAPRVEHLIIYKKLSNYHFNQQFIVIYIRRAHGAIPWL